MCKSKPEVPKNDPKSPKVEVGNKSKPRLRAGSGRSIDFNGDVVLSDYDEPEVRPDGLKPRVKSNILAAAKGRKGHKAKDHFKHSKRVLNFNFTTRRPLVQGKEHFSNGKYM